MLLSAAGLHAQAPLRQSLDIVVPVAPVPARVGDVTQLGYELHLTNFGWGPVTLSRVHVLAGRERVALATVEGQALDSLLGHAGPSADGASRLVIEPGARRVVYFNLPVRRASPTGELRHRIDFSLAVGGKDERHSVEGGTTTVDAAPLPELGPPLRGGPWAAVYAPEREGGHRRVIYAVEGRARIPGRFAIDWFGVDGQGNVERGGGKRLTDYIGYGAEVLAVADGVVAAARDDFSEPETTVDPPRVSLADATGNYIALDIGIGRFVFYEHLRPGLRVRAGDRVRKGQVIAAVGFTGQGSMPHLHFHVSDANSALGAEGRPFHLSEFTAVGTYPSIEAFGRGEAWRRLPRPLRSGPGVPAPNTVVEFAR